MIRTFVSACLLWLAAIAVQAADDVRSDSLTVAYLRSQGIEFTHNNRVVLLPSGTEKFADMFAAIRQAKSSVHLEYFNFRNDSIANALFDLLAEKVKEGVVVRALFDGFGNSSNNRPLKRRQMQSIRERGIQIYEFDPLKFPWINHALHRDHRKIVVIDGEIGYTGGMNVADYYITGRPEFGAWHDMHARIEGDAVGYLQRIFLTMWKITTGEDVSGADYYPGMADASQDFTGLKPDTTATTGHKMVGIVDRVPHESPKIIRQAYQSAIDNAQENIQIINPYLTLVGSVRKALNRAIKRGVKVEIMVSSKSDIPITPDVVAYTVHKLMKRGAHVYFYNEGFHHTKVMMVDSTFCTVGSANLNSRSLCYDYEVNAFVIDPHTTAELSRLFEADKAKSTYLTPQEWKKRPCGTRFRGWIFHLLRPFI